MKKFAWVILIPFGLIFLMARKKTAPANTDGNANTAKPYDPVSDWFKSIKVPTPGTGVNSTVGLIGAGAGAFKVIADSLKGFNFGGSSASKTPGPNYDAVTPGALFTPNAPSSDSGALYLGNDLPDYFRNDSSDFFEAYGMYDDSNINPTIEG